MPLVRLRAGTTPYVLVKVDHTGADIVCADGDGLDAQLLRSEGDHDVIHKVPGGGWSQRRYQSRVEDSWERNAEQVVRDLDKIVADHPGAPVFLVGDPYARSVVQSNATGRIAERLTDLGHGSRAPGSSEQLVDLMIQDELSARRTQARDRLLGTYQERVHQSGAAAMNVGEVIRALREGSLETLLLVDRPESTERLWAGPFPTQLGRTADDLTVLGVDGGFEDRVDEVLVRGLVDVDGDLRLLEPTEVLPDGVGGLLRYDSGEVRPS
jgi:hypothetical protein